MNMTCYIVDDEPLAIEVIKTHAASFADLEVVDTFRNAVDAFRALEDRPVNVLFVDIEMPRVSGLDLIRSLPNPPLVILITAHREYAVDGFELDVLDYLVKPVRFERFARAVARARRRLKPPGVPIDEFLEITVGRRNVRIPVSEIVWIESRRDCVDIHARSGTRTARENVKDLAERLERHGLIRIHRSFMVARHHIESWSAGEVVAGGRTLPIGRTYRQVVAQELGTGKTISEV